MYSSSVPGDFLHEPFGPFQEAFHSDLEQVLAINPFYYDICLKTGEQVLWRPWEHADQSVSAIMKRWDALKTTIASGFRSRQKKASRKDMIDGVSLFVCCLYWSSGKPVGHLDLRNTDWTAFDIQPVNVHERLNYILIKPEQYHSFVQLDQLFQECEKQFSKQMALKKYKQKNAGKSE
ncbi:MULTISPECIES: YpoC family protein [Metabacillus]|uniref:YpoC family protein n=1 Tax=Metabacillus TaxID=2675233 RepID=UPI0004931364|nr:MULTISPECIES: hypothetical protein [Metabacillus]KEZ50681.1 hypothetical protein AZ46_0208490 [Metabacillus indicus LMG 22858]